MMIKKLLPFSLKQKKVSLLIILVIIFIATFLRTWQLDSKAIFFGDAGHDILSAVTAVEERSLPLLGIESSVPRFKQGPVTVWIHMLIYSLVGLELFWFWLVFALLGVAAVIAIYELASIYANQQVALLSAWLVATSPLAVAHSRMAYHITPIPFVMVLFLASLVRLKQNKKWAVFWAVLSFCLLFQFELAVAPAFGVIGWYVFQHKLFLQRSSYLQAAGATLIGLLPQIIYDLTHWFSHLGGFAAWVGYRVVSTAPTGNHQFSLTKIETVSTTIATYFGRIFSFGSLTALIVLATLILIFYFLFKQFWQKKLNPLTEVSLLTAAILILAFVIHGGPSEAYFPPFIVLLPLLVSAAVTQLHTHVQSVVITVLILVGILNIAIINQSNFFTSPSNTFSYSYPLAEQRQVVRYIDAASQGSFQFATTNPGGKYPNFFDNLRVVLLAEDLPTESKLGKIYYIEEPNSEMTEYPNTVEIEFPSVSVINLL